ncbi:MAG: response regulator [Leptolyngbyaceae bacterium]|nr:response regulator [Leptolyngbyaceae bacterium]
MSTVLVVDDTPSQLELVSKYLQEGGYSVIIAADAKEGLSKALSLKPDLVITDVVMPGMSGFELCRSLKKHPDLSKLPIIICSSKNQELDRLWAMKQGADAYVVKPFTRDELLKTIRNVL